MATLVLDTLWSEYNIEQLQIWDSPFYESAEIELNQSYMKYVPTHMGTWLIYEQYWMIWKYIYIFLNYGISNLMTAPDNLHFAMG